VSDGEQPRVEADGDGSRLFVRARPGARRSGLGEPWLDHVTVVVREPPEDGRANAAVLEVLADVLGLRPGALRLLQGHTHRNKVVYVPLHPDEVRARIAAGR
jgi:uncharacterized protein